MDEAVIKYYRKLLRYGFEHMGKLENPTIFLDSVGENIKVCAQVAQAYIHLYINIKDDVIDDTKYLCMCDPTSNVAVEVMCSLIKGKPVEQVRNLSEKDFSQEVGSKGKEFLKSTAGLIKLLNLGLDRHKKQT